MYTTNAITHVSPEKIEFSRQLNIGGFDTESVFMNLESEDSINAYKNHVVEKYGKVNILVNNAVVRSGGDFNNTTSKQWKYTSRCNSLGM